MRVKKFGSRFPIPALSLFLLAALALPGCGGSAETGGGGGGPGPTPLTITTDPANGAAVNPASLTQFTVNFNMAMDTQPSAPPVVMTESKGGSTTDITAAAFSNVVWSNGDKTVTVDVSSYLFKEGATYTVTFLAGLFTSADGAATLAQDQVVTFTTLATPPFVAGTFPGHLDTGVNLDTLVVISFSEPMDTTDFTKNAVIFPAPGTISAAWSSADSILTLDFSPGGLSTDTTYTLSLSTAVSDIRGSNLASPLSLTFSTGAALVTGGIAGSFSDDPASPFDDPLSRATAALFGSDPTMGGADPLAFAPAPGGAFSFRNLPDGTYFLAGIVDSNGDGDLNERRGDAFGYYPDPLTANAVSVSAGAFTYLSDFTLYDSEAISGRITFGPLTDPVDLQNDDLDPFYLYAFSEPDFYRGEMILTNEWYDQTVAETVSGSVAEYWLNPFSTPDLSFEGTYGGLNPVTRNWIPPGDYRVACYLYSYTSDREYLGFSPTASIAGTGADAVGNDITLYETTSIAGRVMRIDSLEQMPAFYGSARVSLIDWPYQEVASTGSGYAWFGETQYYSPTGFFQYDYAPVNKQVYFHVEPGPDEAADYLPTNFDYETFDSMGSTEEELLLISRSLAAAWALRIPGTPALDPAKAQVGGSVWDLALDQPAVGAFLSVPGATTWYFTDGTFAAVDQGGTRDIQNGPQFLIVNAPPPATGDKVLGTLTVGGETSQGYLPLRAGEMTILDIGLNQPTGPQ